MCRNISTEGECNHNKKCAYFHEPQDNLKLKFNEIVLFLVLRNQQDINAMKEEVKQLESDLDIIF